MPDAELREEIIYCLMRAPARLAEMAEALLPIIAAREASARREGAVPDTTLQERAEHLAQNIIQCVASQLDENRSEEVIVPLIVDALDSARREALREAAEACDEAKAGALKHYGVAESVGADMAKRRIEALAPAIPAAGGGDEAREQRHRAQDTKVIAALKRLTVAARTSGGLSTRDAELCAACDEAEAVLHATEPTPNPGPDNDDGTQEAGT
jgi:hypothetical protein